MPYGYGMGGYGMYPGMYGGGGAYNETIPEQVRTPDIADALMKGMAFRQQQQDQQSMDQERQNQLTIQRMQIQKAQRDQLAQEGQDVFYSGDKDKWTDWSKLNPNLAKQIQAADDLKQARQEEMYDTLFKNRVAGLTFEQIQDPNVRAQLQKFAPGGQIPTFKNQDEFNEWQMRIAGGSGSKNPYTEQKDKLDLIKTQLDIQKELAAEQEKRRGAYSYTDAFTDVSSAVDNDTDLKKLDADPLDENGKVSGAGPRTLAKTNITRNAMDLWNQYPTISRQEAEDNSIAMYKAQMPQHKANFNHDFNALKKDPKNQKLRDQFSKLWGIDSGLLLGDYGK